MPDFFAHAKDTTAPTESIRIGAERRAPEALRRQSVRLAPRTSADSAKLLQALLCKRCSLDVDTRPFHQKSAAGPPPGCGPWSLGRTWRRTPWQRGRSVTWCPVPNDCVCLLLASSRTCMGWQVCSAFMLGRSLPMEHETTTTEMVYPIS